MSTKRYDVITTDNKKMRNAPKLLYISSAKYGGDWHSTPHTHNCSELFFITQGLGQFQIEEQIHSVGSSDLIIVNPNVVHTEVSLNAHPLEYIVLGVEGLELAITNTSEQRYCIVNCLSIRDTILFYLQNILREIESKSLNYDIVCQNLMEILMILIMRQTGLTSTLIPIKKNATHLSSTIRRYIDAHYRENITLDTLIEMTHVSKYYLVHAFTKEYDISPINYVIQKRIEEAKQLLKNDDYTLSSISRILGFSSPSYFSQTFKRLTGISPNEYRKQSRMQK